MKILRNCGDLTSREFIKITRRTEAGCIKPDLTGVGADRKPGLEMMS